VEAVMETPKNLLAKVLFESIPKPVKS